MDYQALANLLFPDVTDTPEALEERFPCRSLPEGAAVSAEPGIYIPGKFGVRIEDMICITPDGCDNLTEFTKELIILD